MERDPWDPEGAERLIDADGTPRDEAAVADLPLERLYRAMVGARTLDLKVARLGLPARASWAGEEAVTAALTVAARPDDWVFPGPRDGAVAFLRGMSADDAAAFLMGRGGPAAGLPTRDQLADPEGRTAPLPRALARHLAMAVGAARGQRVAGSDGVVFASCGEGSAACGAFHESLVAAAAADLPVIFVCKTQVWPEGAPPEAGVVGDGVADRARGLGLWTRRVDGACAAAALHRIAEAARRARQGNGPALVEVVVTPLVLDPPASRDPIERLRRYLDRQGKWTRAFQDVAEAEVRTRIERALSRLESRQEAPAP